MKEIIRKFLPQWGINYFWHLPRAILANIFYGFPTRGLKVVGVTGTDGKTTTVHMIYEILKAAGKKVSMISTISAPGLHVTSPDPFWVQKFAKEHGDEYLVLEVTSHALDQFRFWGIKFEVGVITNITHEHLDYHKTFENYKNTKLKLLKMAKIPVQYKKLDLKLKIPGEYNIENASSAIAVTTALGIDQKIARKTLENFTGLVGRMEEIKNKKGIRIIIDFAHTPNGLEQALKALRKLTKGKLITVFGSAGQRDVGKRPLMGKIAGELADYAVITAEDPRGELETINKQILQGIKKGVDFFVIEDREKAIDFAINKLAKKGDIVGIFGKGHEKSMNLDGKIEIPWSDKETVLKILHG